MEDYTQAEEVAQEHSLQLRVLQLTTQAAVEDVEEILVLMEASAAEEMLEHLESLAQLVHQIQAVAVVQEEQVLVDLDLMEVLVSCCLLIKIL